MEIIDENLNVFVRHALLLKDGTWATWKLSDPASEPINWWEDKWKDIMHIETHPYFYFHEHKGDQSCMATVRVEEREWINSATGDRLVHKDIHVSFDKELGAEAGTYKGGVIGVSYQMLPNETPLMTLRRMEKDRTFK